MRGVFSWIERKLYGLVLNKHEEGGDFNVPVLWDPKVDAIEGLNKGFGFTIAVLVLFSEYLIIVLYFSWNWPWMLVVISLCPTALLLSQWSNMITFQGSKLIMATQLFLPKIRIWSLLLTYYPIQIRFCCSLGT